MLSLQQAVLLYGWINRLYKFVSSFLCTGQTFFYAFCPFELISESHCNAVHIRSVKYCFKFKGSDRILSVTLYSNTFAKDGQMIGKVSRNTVTLENMIAAIISENRGLDPFMVQHSAILLQQQIIKMLQLGRCVNVLDL